MTETTYYRRTWYLCLAFLLVLIYSNSFDCGWHFDDSHNILENSKVKLTSFDFDTVLLCIKGNPNGDKIWRPISFISFGLNWIIGADNVYGYHIVNLMIHIINSFLLYKVGLCLLSICTPGEFRRNHMVSALSATIWAIHPIQTQSVTYIVQRMASLSALFYLLAMLFFLEFKNFKTKNRWYYLVSAGGFALFSFFSKENGVLALLSVVVVELVFYYDTYSENVKLITKRILLLGGFLCVCIFGVIYYYEYFSYETRSFTQLQRLLTQPRVLFFYLGLIFYPVSTRYSIIHDYELSHGLFDPLSTIVSIVLILMLIVLSFVLARKYKILSFAVLFFFCNHLIESTIVPLEMVYEHRNYIPSMFLFLPIAKGLVDYLQTSSKLLSVIVPIVISLIMIFVGMGTYTRNIDWKTEESLWQSALRHAPHSARVYQNLAVTCLENQSITLDQYIKLNQIAYRYDDNSTYRSKYISLYNQVYAYKKQGSFDKAIKVAEMMNHIDSEGRDDGGKNTLRLIELSFLNNDLNRAGMLLLDLGHRFQGELGTQVGLNGKFLQLSGIFNIKSQNYELAYDYGKQLLKFPESAYKAYAIMAYSLIRLGDYEKAEHYIRLMKRSHKDIYIEFIVELEYLKVFGSEVQLQKHLQSFLANVSLLELEKFEDSFKVRILPVDSDYSLINEIQVHDFRVNDLLI